MPTYYEKRYCFQCICVHWLEVTPTNKDICHGESFNPLTVTATHYPRRQGKGFEVIEKMTFTKGKAKSQQLPLEWQLRADAEV